MHGCRTDAELSIHDGDHRSFEWYWAQDNTMPGLDAYENLDERERDDFLASLVHWGDLRPGIRPLESRINSEHTDPVVVAIKAGKHRFTAFREESGSTWIVCRHYLKEGKKRDKVGDRAVLRTLEMRNDYRIRVKEGSYYERG